jgi:hypothetical protein
VPSRVLAAVFGVAAIACVPGPPTAARTDVPPPPVFRQDRDALLVAALPVESGGVTVLYDVRGPAGIAGELEAHARAGGWRRERWTMRGSSASGQPIELAGERVVTPDFVYRVDANGRTLTRSSLGSLADAWLAADAPTRAAALTHVERWSTAMAQARHDQPGPTREIAGTTCAVLSVGGAELCVWEAAGLPLSYRGEAFELTAQSVVHGVTHDDSTFAIPDGLVATAARTAESPRQRVERLARGDVRELAALATPSVPF